MWRAITTMGMPLVLAQVVNVAYSMVDRVYIGHIPGVGTEALTGIGICAPIITIITAFANMCGTGGGPLCSIERGKGQLREAEKILADGFYMLVSLGLVITLLFQLLLKKLLMAFGASDESFGYAFGYARIYLLGTVFAMLSAGLVFFINAQGFSKVGMRAVLVGAITNIVLDPVLIYWLGMGVRGAAIATVVAQFVSAVWCLRFLTCDRAILKLRKYELDWHVVKRIIGLGLSGFIISVTAGIVQIACNKQLGRFGGDIYIALMTIVYSFREVVFNIIHGYTNGAQPVLGYNYGAGEYDRIRIGVKYLTGICLVYGSIVTIVAMTLPKQIISLYNGSEELLSVGATGFRLYFAAFFVLSLQMVCQCLFVGLGLSKLSIVFAVLRKIVIIVPLIYILPPIEGIGPNGVFLAELISDVVSGVICYFTMYYKVYTKLGTGRLKVKKV